MAVADDEILGDQRLLGSLEGWFICPQGAAAISAVWCLSDSGWRSARDEVVILNTGTGLKYRGTVATELRILRPGDQLSFGTATPAHRPGVPSGHR